MRLNRSIQITAFIAIALIFLIRSCPWEYHKKEPAKKSDIVEIVKDSTQIQDSIQAVKDSLSMYRKGVIKPNQGIFQVLEDLNIGVAAALDVTNVLRFNVELTSLKAGEEITVRMSPDSSRILELIYEPNPVVDHKVTWNPDSGIYEYSMIELPTVTRYRLIEGEIEAGSTLNQMLLDKNIPPNLTQVINGIMMCKISFRTQARQGDKVKVLLQERYYNDYFLDGNVLYASYNGKKTGFHEAFRYFEDDPKSSFNAHYTREGEALIHSGLRYPVDRLHISSPYGMRYHPITGRRQMHFGVDYSAPSGSNVYAVAKGQVILSSYDNYSGNKIAIRHADGTVSYYLHLSRKLVKKGQEVRTRQIIGKVGSTGRSTGPHLHFGFKKSNGQWMNPLSKRMIATPRLKDERLRLLEKQIKYTLDQIAVIESE